MISETLSPEPLHPADDIDPREWLDALPRVVPEVVDPDADDFDFMEFAQIAIEEMRRGEF